MTDTYKGAELTTSQDYLDDATVERKINNQDFAVLVSPEFDVDGRKYRVILDGHHSFEAATLSGNEPDFEEASVQDSDNIQMLLDGDIEDFLKAVHMGVDYHNPVTKNYTW